VAQRHRLDELPSVTVRMRGILAAVLAGGLALAVASPALSDDGAGTAGTGDVATAATEHGSTRATSVPVAPPTAPDGPPDTIIDDTVPGPGPSVPPPSSAPEATDPALGPDPAPSPVPLPEAGPGVAPVPDAAAPTTLAGIFSGISGISGVGAVAASGPTTRASGAANGSYRPPGRGSPQQVGPTLPPRPPEELLPADSGTGRRVVYSISRQRVWAVEGDGTVVKTHRVSGKAGVPYAGTYFVWSRSMYTHSAANPSIRWMYMVRFAHTPRGGNVGFHEIPTQCDGRGSCWKMQTEAQLGTPLSGGCVRQSTPDAIWMWNWAGIGTKVVVLP
jgi:lipoprotein-anchoring transpeptidase ErfK/SrfK